MCGIVGLAYNDQRDVDQHLLARMAGLIHHRGPDSQGFFFEGSVGLAHKRLAIIDLEQGQQPIFNEDKSLVIVYNGEVYNFRELRETLQHKGHVFLTRTDTEVLLHAYEEWGIDALEKFNGMFALVIFDRRHQDLFLARDRLGIKPLYYYLDDDCLVFASEIKAMLPALPYRRPYLPAIYEHLTFQNILSDDTFFDGIKKLPPGQWLRWERRGVVRGCYWSISFPSNGETTFPEAVKDYGEALEHAVQRHLIADVPVGAQLSGGFDSGSVALLAGKQLSTPLHTFTGAFADGFYYDERDGARAIAAQVGAAVHEILITPQDYLENIAKVVYHLDEPTLGSGALPHYMVNREVAKYVKVVLTGHGGDEAYAGYQVNKVAWLKESWDQSMWQFFRAMLGIRPDEWTRVLYYLFYPLIYPEVRHGMFIMVPPKKRTEFFTPEFLKSNRGVEPLEIFSNEVYGGEATPGQKLTRLYLRGYLPTLFLQEDKMGMAHSLETRIPLCDNEIIELSLRLPLSVKLHGQTLKAIPKETLRKQMPELIYRLPKRGFPTPFARWFRQEPLKSFMEDLLLGNRLRERGIFNQSTLKDLFHRNRLAKTDTLFDYARANVLYSCSLIELWHRAFMDGGAGSSS